MHAVRRVAVLAALISTVSVGLTADPASAASAGFSFASSYAVASGTPVGAGSVTYTASSGVRNFLRATATADVASPFYQVVSRRSGGIKSASARYMGPMNGIVAVRLSGTLTRELNGGFSLTNGAGFRHLITWALWDTTANSLVRSWTISDEEIACGALVYPIAPMGCNNTQSDIYPSSFVRTVSGPGIVNGHYYQLRVIVLSQITAVGVVGGLVGRTTASSLSGSLSW